MKKISVAGVDAKISTGNVFADLNLADPEKLKIKAGLALQIKQSVQKNKMNQQDAALKMGISQAKVSNLMRGDFSGLSERKLMDCLNRLGYDIEIKVKKTTQEVGHLILAY